MSEKSDHNSQNSSDTENCKVYISNINKTIVQEEIRKKFSQFGVIKSLILKKKDNNVTYSFIEYDKPSQAKAAIAEMNKKIYCDRILKVEYGKGGNKGLQHYHTNRYDKLKDDPEGARKYDEFKKRSYDDRRYSSYSSDSYDDRYRERSPRRQEKRQRRDYKDFDKYQRRGRSRSRSYEGRQKRDYRQKEYYRPNDRYKQRRDYFERDARDREYDQRRYRERDDKYDRYHKDRKDDRRDYSKYEKYEKDRRRDYDHPNKYEEPKQLQRYSKQASRYPKEGDRYPKEPQRYVKQTQRYKEGERYPKETDRYPGSYGRHPGQTERYDKYRNGQYKDYKREGYERRKEYSRDEPQPTDRKDSKEYQGNYQPRPNNNSYDKPRNEGAPRVDDR